jgi:hypothetical protein
VAIAELNTVAIPVVCAVEPFPLKMPVENGIWQTSLFAAGAPLEQLICPTAPKLDRETSSSNCRVRFVICVPSV